MIPAIPHFPTQFTVIVFITATAFAKVVLFRRYRSTDEELPTIPPHNGISLS
jgi:hypothetical protein